MTRSILSILLFFLATSVMVAQQTTQQEQVIGSWNGALQLGNSKLRLVFHISTNSDGALVATMDSPDQGAKGIPVQRVSIVQDSIHLAIPAIGGSYSGKITAADKIDGILKQGPQKMSIPLTKGIAEEIKRPQEPVKPYPYKEEEVIVENKEAGIKLAGTITLPASKGPHPAVILFTGSGPQDRDETIMGHKPFLVLADYLTRQGFAVLRLDNRGVGQSEGNFATATTQDLATDGNAAFQYLRTREEISPKKIALIGHSEGALVATKVAVQNPSTAFVVMLAGTGVRGTEVMVAQNEAILKTAGLPDNILKPYLELRRQQFEVAANEPDILKASEKIRLLEQEAKENFTELEQQQLGLTPEGEKLVVAQLSSPWFKYFLAYDPAPALRKLKIPVLALNGTLDLQVPYQQNLPAIEKALKAGRNKRYQVQEMPGLNHLFQTAITGSISEYGQIEETIAPVALETIGNWLKTVVR